MVRFVTCVFLALFALVVLSPSCSTTGQAVSTFSETADGKSADEANADGHGEGEEVDDAEFGEDEDIDVEGDENDDEDADLDDDDDSEDDDDDLPPDDDDDDSADTEPAGDQPTVLDPPGKENDKSYVAPSATGAVFFDNFQDGLGKWTHTSTEGYEGKFATGQGANPTLPGDRALIIPEKARKYGMSAAIPGLSSLSGKSLVVQYELKLDQGMTCGGAYLKLPLADFKVSELTGDTPYSIMFGPDKCGSTDKVHFIFQSLNPVTGKRTEHHLKTPPQVANSYDKKTHLYTLIVNDDATFEVKVDNEKKSYGSLNEKFEPPVQPPKEIDDPEDTKPSDWVDTKEIEDPSATKPDDWDEDAPAQIVDEDAVKPEGWLDDEKDKIPDPDAKKPDGWDDEDDGKWEAPVVGNPKCDAVGCGEWKRPMKTNPDYKGKWKAPKIKNPDYIGDWKPRKIANPDYYVVDSPHLLGIGGVAFEIWTMDQGVLFDNVWLGNDIVAADRYANETFVVKQVTEIEREEADRKKADESAKKKKKKGGKGEKTSSLGPILEKIEEVVDKLEDVLTPLEAWIQKMGYEQYLDMLIDAGIKKPMLVVVSIPLVVTVLMLLLLGGGKKRSADAGEASTVSDADSKKTDAVTKDSEAEADENAENIDEAEGAQDSGLRQRTGRSDS